MDRTPQILIVDDDPEIRTLLSNYLVRQGLRTHTAGDGEAMWRLLARQAVDLIVLDLMLLGDDGLELCRQLRTHSDLPVITLTARGDATGRIVELELGADDYLPKPFDPRELLARIRATLRRAGSRRRDGAATDRLRFDGWTLDRQRHELHDPDGTVVPLSGGEYRLLEIFVERPNRALGRELLLDLLQGREATPYDRSVDVQVSRLHPDYLFAAQVVPAGD